MLVNAVAPGFIETDMTDDINTKAYRKDSNAAIRRPSEVASVVSSSPDWSYMTGQVLGINGGIYM